VTGHTVGSGAAIDRPVMMAHATAAGEWRYATVPAIVGRFTHARPGCQCPCPGWSVATRRATSITALRIIRQGGHQMGTRRSGRTSGAHAGGSTNPAPLACPGLMAMSGMAKGQAPVTPRLGLDWRVERNCPIPHARARRRVVEYDAVRSWSSPAAPAPRPRPPACTSPRDVDHPPCPRPWRRLMQHGGR